MEEMHDLLIMSEWITGLLFFLGAFAVIMSVSYFVAHGLGRLADFIDRKSQ